jgi:hypothetical protein
MVMPLLQEARDALPAISIVAAKLHHVDLTLGDRMDIAGMYSLDDWLADNAPARSPVGRGADALLDSAQKT